MEAGQKRNAASDVAVDLNSEVKNELKQSSETLSNTKSILESICSDFQNIDVLSPKDKLPNNVQVPENSSRKNSTANLNKSANHSNKTQGVSSNHVETRNSASEQSKDNATATSAPNKDSHLQTSVASCAESIKPVLEQSDVGKSVCVEDNSTKDKFISASSAELADVEIVQTDGNVSLVITNPRLIQVLNSEDGGQYQTVEAVPQVASTAVPVVAEPSIAVEQDVTIPDEINEVAELVVCEGPRKRGPKKRKYNISSTSKKKAKPPPFKQKAISGKMTKARRISAKMKTEWAKTLAKKGSLVCPMQGCYQKYVTIANFLTHYKFCPGRELKPCPYCSSLIFSEKQAVLHHMEVEHPDKVDEYKANISDDESSEHFEEEIILRPPVKVEKRKVCYMMSKENQSPKGKKHKIFKSIAHESEIENIKEFRKCVRFDNIVSKINSCDQSDTSESLETSATPSTFKSTKERRKRLIVTEKIVEEEKYFEDADEFLKLEPKIEDDNFKLNTKSRLVLNLERYKQFNQHLKLTRDWSSARKTYSRSRISESSFDSSCTSLQSITELPQDAHQLDDLCLQNTTNEEDSEVIYIVPKELSEFDLESTKGIKKTRPSLISQSNSARKRVGILREKIENTTEIETPSPIKPTAFSTPNSDKPLNGLVLKEKKVPCYLRDSIANATSTPKTSSEPTRKPGTKMGSLITYGKNIPVSEEKKIKTEKLPVVDFDTLFKNSMNEMKLLREKSDSFSFAACEANQAGKSVNDVKDGQGNNMKHGKNNKGKHAKANKVNDVTANESKHLKENGIKEPEKRKRGRPRKRALPEPEQENPSLHQKTDDEIVSEKQMLEAIQNDAKARNLKNHQARAYIKSQREKSIKNLNLRRFNRLHMEVVPDPSTISNDSMRLEEKCNNISQVANSLTKNQNSTINETEVQNNSTTTDENFQCEQQKNDLNQNLELVKSTPLPPIETNESKLTQREDVNLEKSDTSTTNISSTVNPEIKANEKETVLEISTDAKTNHAEPSYVQLSANAECSVEAQQVDSSCRNEISKDTDVSNESSSQVLDVPQPVKRRRGRPKKIVSELKANMLTAATSTCALVSDLVQSSAEQSSTNQTQAIQSEAMECDTVQTAVANQPKSVDLEVQSSVVLSSTEKPEAVSSGAIQSASEVLAVEKPDENKQDSKKSVIDKTEVPKIGNELANSIQSAVELTELVAKVAGEETEVTQPVAEVTGIIQPVANETEVTQPTVETATTQSAAEIEATQSAAEIETSQSVADSEATQSAAETETTQPAAETEATQPAVETEATQPAVETEATQPVAETETTQPAAETEATQPAAETETTQSAPEATQALAESEATQAATVAETTQSVAESASEQTGTVQSDAQLSKVPLRKSLRAKKRKVSSSNEDYVFPPTSKKEFDSLTNSEEPVLPVKTGRRGRPRKYSLKSDLDSSANETFEEPVANEGINEQIPNQIEVAPVQATEFVTVKTGKRGRPRKVPLSDLNSSVTESDNSMVLAEVPNVVPERTGRRGRPRKYPKPDLNSSSEVNSSLNLSLSLNESTVSNSSLRKCPRKGRPMKCVHYEALNSQTGPSSNVEMVNEKKSETNTENGQIGTSETNSAGLLKNKDSADRACSKPEKLILPPKKRKIADDSEPMPEKSTKKSDDPDYSAVQDISEEESDVEQPTKAKRNLDLPYRPGKKKSKKSMKKSHSPSHRKVVSTLSKPNLQFLFDFTGTVYEEKELYSNLKPMQSMFTSLSEGEWQEFLPTVDSISIKIETAEIKNDWIKLKCFESVSNEAFKNFTFFVGGPVTTSAFCPTPRDMICDQYIALASNYSLLNIHYASTKPQRGLIQFYNLGNLQNTAHPVLELALCHQNATITDMQWCPRGCYEQLPVPSNQVSNRNKMPRLGLLAVASADSFVRIYAVPHPKCLNDWDNTSLPFFNCSPSVILEPMNGATRASIATSLTWADTEECDQIAVGYGNGMVCIWLVNTTNSILLSRETASIKTIIPYQVFQAHGTPVTSLQFAPLQNCRYLVSSGFDKTLKYFDLLDTSMPFCSAKRGCAINCQWSSSLCGAYVSLHDGITFKGSNYFKDSGTEEFPAQNISGSISSLTQSSVSDAINALATADMKGSVSVKCLNKSMLVGSEAGRLPPTTTYKIFNAELTSFQNSIKNELTDVKSPPCIMKDVIDVTWELATQVETAIESENNRALESTVSELIDEVLTVTVENISKLCEAPPTIKVESDIIETEVENLLNCVREATVNSVKSETEKNTELELQVNPEDTSSSVGDKLPHKVDNMDSQSNKHSLVTEIDAEQTAVSLTNSDALDDCLDKCSESLPINNVPDILCHTSEILPANHPESNAISSIPNSFVSEKDSEVIDEPIDICNADSASSEKNPLEGGFLPTSSDISDDYYSQDVTETIELSDEDSFSSEDNDSDKDMDIAYDVDNFSDDSMMSECSLSSKSESSYSSDNGMDESASMDYIDDLDSRYSPEPKDPAMVEDSLKNSDLESSSAPNDSLSAKDCLQSSELTVTNESPSVKESLKDSEIESTCVPTDSLLSEKVSKSSEPIPTPDDSPVSKTQNLPPHAVSPDNGVCMSADKGQGTSDSLSSNLKDSSETTSNSSGVVCNSSEDSVFITEPTEHSASCTHKDTPSNDPNSKSLDPSVCQFYEQHTRTSKPYMQSFKPENEACGSNTENENGVCEIVGKVGNEASRDKCATYENIISTHGVIFTDMFLDSKDDNFSITGDEMEKLPALEHNNFSSVNTISWNPNHGCEYWLFTAGNSGIARLCCVSNINATDHTSHQKDT